MILGLIFNLYYLSDKIKSKELEECLELYIFNDEKMREKHNNDIFNRLEKIFSNTNYKTILEKSDKKWIDEPITLIFEKIMNIFQTTS